MLTLGARPSQAVFRVLLSTLSRPGRVEHLPIEDVGAAVVPLSLAVVDSVIAVCGDDDLEQDVKAAAGCTVGPLEEAQLVALCGTPTATQILSLRRGSALAPEEGAKVGIDCERLQPGSHAGAGVTANGVPGSDAKAPGAGVTVVLSGPGVDGHAILAVEGVDADVFAAVAEANRDYPAGIDLWFVDRAGRIAGIPRSSNVEVL